MREKPESLYLFAVSVVVAVVWVDSCPWRYGEQHFSRRYVRSGELSPGCQLTSAAGEVRAWSPAAWLRVVLLLRQDRGPHRWPPGHFRGPSHGSKGGPRRRGGGGLARLPSPPTVISPTPEGGRLCGRIRWRGASENCDRGQNPHKKIRLWWTMFFFWFFFAWGGEVLTHSLTSLHFNIKSNSSYLCSLISQSHWLRGYFYKLYSETTPSVLRPSIWVRKNLPCWEKKQNKKKTRITWGEKIEETSGSARMDTNAIDVPCTEQNNKLHWQHIWDKL